jgi:hypothetical protein
MGKVKVGVIGYGTIFANGPAGVYEQAVSTILPLVHHEQNH